MASSGSAAADADVGVVTTQLTSKKYGAQILTAGIVMIFGLLMLFGGGRDHGGVGLLALLVGAVWLIAVKFLVWWCHA